MKKQSWLVAVILVFGMLISSCGNTAAPVTSATPSDNAPATSDSGGGTADNSDVKVFMSIALGGLGDQGYNDSAYAGAMLAQEELGITLDVYEPTSISEIEAQLMTVAASGEYDLILGIGADNASGVEKAAAAYPDQAFACYQAVIDLPNVVSSNQALEEPGYQLGVLCALLLNENALPGVPEGTHSVGVVLGTTSSEILTQVYSMWAGGLSVDPEFELNVTEVGNWNDQAKAKELTASLFDRGCGIVFHGAGAAGLGMFEAAKEYGGYVIGSSSNQNGNTDTVICSRMERMDLSVYETIAQFVDGTFTSGSLRMGIADGVCYNEFEGSKVEIPEDIMAQFNEIGEQIVNGEIDIPTTEEELEAFRDAM